MEIPRKIEKALRHVNWPQITPYILRYLAGKTKQTPRLVTLYEDFKEKDNKLYVYGREVVIDPNRKYKILNQEEENYGGIRKASDRINRKYFGISRSDVVQFFGGSERRQLKARKQKTKKIESYVHATTPGSLQVDLTFYKGQKIPVFGAVDVFSRYAYYERVPNKRADFVVKAMQNCIAHFKKHCPHRVVKVSSDAGVEFQAEFKAYLKQNKIFYDKQVRSRKMIESLNRTLRRYIERVGWERVTELDDLIAKFLHTYNRTKHNTTNKVPIHLLKLQDKERKKESAKQQSAGQKRMQGQGFNVAPLKPGDKVRIYDPKRQEIKDEQKKKIKGVKLSEKDYVKQYTGKHMGNDPHWTKQVYIVERIIIGNRAQRYILVGKKGAFIRSELQKVKAITKRDPRVKKKIKRKQKIDKLDERKPKEIRDVKHTQFHIYFKPNRRGLTLATYKNFILIMARQKLLIRTAAEIVRVTNDKVKHNDFKELVQKFNEPLKEAKQNIDDYLAGRTNQLKQPVQNPRIKEKMIGRHVITLWDGDIYKPYAFILEEYKNHYIVQYSDDNSITYIPKSDVHKKLNKIEPMSYVRDTIKLNEKQIQTARSQIDEI